MGVESVDVDVILYSNRCRINHKMFRCGDITFDIVHDTYLTKLIDSVGSYDISSNDIPESYKTGVLFYSGQNNIACGRDIIELLNFLLFAEIDVKSFIDDRVILDVLLGDNTWHCDRINVTNYIVECVMQMQTWSYDKMQILYTWIVYENMDPYNLNVLNVNDDCACGDISTISQFPNLVTLHLHSTNISTLTGLEMNLSNFSCDSLLIFEDVDLGNVSIFRELCELNLKLVNGSTNLPSRIHNVIMNGNNHPNLMKMKMSVAALTAPARLYASVATPLLIYVSGDFNELNELDVENVIISNIKIPILKKLRTNCTRPFMNDVHTNLIEFIDASESTFLYERQSISITDTFPALKKLTFESLPSAHRHDTMITIDSMTVETLAIGVNNSNDCYARNIRIHLNFPKLHELIVVSDINLELDNKFIENVICRKSSTYDIFNCHTVRKSSCINWLTSSPKIGTLLFEHDGKPLTFSNQSMYNPANMENVENFIPIDNDGQSITLDRLYGGFWNAITLQYPYMLDLNISLSRFESGSNTRAQVYCIPLCMHKFYTDRLEPHYSNYNTIANMARRYVNTMLELSCIRTEYSEFVRTLEDGRSGKLHGDDIDISVERMIRIQNLLARQAKSLHIDNISCIATIEKEKRSQVELLCNMIAAHITELTTMMEQR